LLGPGVAFLLLATGHGFQTVFLVAIGPGVLGVLVFAGLTRDPQTPSSGPRPRRQAMPRPFWRLIAAVGAFGLGNFAVAFLILRALDMLRPELSTAPATAAAVAFFLGVNATGAVVSFPGGWLVDRVGGRSVLAAGYGLFAVACLVAAAGHGAVAVAVVGVARDVPPHSHGMSLEYRTVQGQSPTDPRALGSTPVLSGVSASGWLMTYL
jgi:MFS family permease